MGLSGETSMVQFGSRMVVQPCDRDQMILGVRSPSRPARALFQGNRVLWTAWPDSSFPGLGGSQPSRKGAELRYTKSSTCKGNDVAPADRRSGCTR
ncbi:UNVERIFIED_CONTAM: hypothetical protein FKN15_014718 [Acipenser sinensis]